MSQTTNKLIEEFKRREAICQGVADRETESELSSYYHGKAVAYGEAASQIDHLAKHAPAFDLEHELELYHKGLWPKTDNGDETLSYSKNAVRALADYFYNLRR